MESGIDFVSSHESPVEHLLPCMRAQSCLTFATPWTARPLCLWYSSGKNTGVGCHFLLQGFFPSQGSNLHVLHWQVASLALSHLGSLLSSSSRRVFVYTENLSYSVVNLRELSYLVLLENQLQLSVCTCCFTLHFDVKEMASFLPFHEPTIANFRFSSAASSPLSAFLELRRVRGLTLD